MPSQKLSDPWIRNLTWDRALEAYLKTKDRAGKSPKQIAYFDSMERGLALKLVLSSGGTKMFQVVTYVGSKALTYKLGTFPDLTVKKAKLAARIYYENPVRAEAPNTFREVMEIFLKRHVQVEEFGSRGEIERSLRKHAIPAFGKCSFVELKRKDITKLLEKVADNSGRVTANRLLDHLSKMMNWYATQCGDYRNPVGPNTRRSDPKRASASVRKRSDPDRTLPGRASAKARSRLRAKRNRRRGEIDVN